MLDSQRVYSVWADKEFPTPENDCVGSVFGPNVILANASQESISDLYFQVCFADTINCSQLYG